MSDFEIIDGQKVFYTSSESMAEIPTDSIDVIITSPPYNRSKSYSDDKGNVYNDNQKEDEYESLLNKVWSECFRVLAPHGLFFLNVGESAKNQGFSEKVCHSTKQAGFERLQTIIWVKSILGRGHYTPSGRGRRSSTCVPARGIGPESGTDPSRPEWPDRVSTTPCRLRSHPPQPAFRAPPTPS